MSTVSEARLNTTIPLRSSEVSYMFPNQSKTLLIDESKYRGTHGSHTTESRGELKYLLDKRSYQDLMTIIRPHLEFDEYPISQVTSTYLDTNQNSVIRRSLEKPRYKEKLRIRTYCPHPMPNDRCFLEIKKKFKGVVFKRRVEMSYAEVLEFTRTRKMPEATLSALSDAHRRTAIQILQEVEWLLALYGDLRPSFTVSCNRMSFKEVSTDSLRITFDSDITWSHEGDRANPSFMKVPLIAPGSRIMEIKSTKGLPYWLIEPLSDLQIYPRSFSKVGASYNEWLKETKGK